MPCVVLETQDWSDNFKEEYFTKVKQSDVPETLKRLYNTEPKDYYATGALDYVKELDDKTVQGWIDFIADFVFRTAKNDIAKINEYTTVRYSDYIRDLNRSALAREDFESVLTNRHKFNIVYTDKNTYLSKDDNFVPEEQLTGLALFEGI